MNLLRRSRAPCSPAAAAAFLFAAAAAVLPAAAFRVSRQLAPPGGPPGGPPGAPLGAPPTLMGPPQSPKASQFASPLLKSKARQILKAQQPAASQEAVVDGEWVNGKSVKEWKVKRSIYQALHMAMAEELERDPTVCIIGEDVGHYGGSYKATRELHLRHGNFRCLDTPICENTFLGLGVGAAMAGLRPVVEGMNLAFLLLAFNQLCNNAGMVRATSGGQFRVPLVVRGPGGVGRQLGPEHSQRVEAYLMAVPGLKLVACSTPYNARGLLKTAIREDNPVVFFEHVLNYSNSDFIPLMPYTLSLDKAEQVAAGEDLTLLCYGRLRQVAAAATQQLQQLSVVENCYEDLLMPPVRLSTKDIPTPYSKELEEATIITPADVVNAALWMLSANRK
ncbi:pyruvate dehydrogenase E1 beta subunit, putative [Eimeria tenella]|uniref:Pyruvate dehydrogenase E1 beta subunit, putative n=1 Tax=Eimeria tenella TaxID=5802 RepID=U6KXJ6_EIMTE|nr:pyruvate dehydrogenase E1 beta subunit, putative [Eimeria tenella]CDJ42691.1 pyruvate dehydrogenase E1 beta subunit, putative [Eimeria tenella]|eukprot:XP_013233441.1 pyruvate dehydrogenase E1 beta subunit, putative [Eimeria tenella]